MLDIDVCIVQLHVYTGKIKRAEEAWNSKNRPLDIFYVDNFFTGAGCCSRLLQRIEKDYGIFIYHLKILVCHIEEY